MKTLLPALMALTALSLFGGELRADQPNIIFILVDDQGYYDLSCYGATEFRTPTIDKLAHEGVRFTDYYAAAPICSPSRAGILTGCYPRRVGLATWVQRADSRIGIAPGELTLAELLKAGGYATACIGKWHLGFQTPFLPRAQGFDHYFGLYHNLDPVETVYFKNKGGVPLIRNGKVVKRSPNPAELARVYTDEAIRFMESHRSKKNNQPFFLYLPHTMLHNPLGVSKEFQGKSKLGQYGDAIVELDHHVGRLVAALKRLKIHDNTIVIYTSDNGRGPGRTKNQPLRGRKLTTLELGLRVPAIVWGPKLKIRQNHTSSAVVHAMDWYPTLATLAGVPVPKQRVIDGRDLTALLIGKTDDIPVAGKKVSLNGDVPFRREWQPAGEWAPLIKRREYQNAFFVHGSQGALAAVRSGPWKLHLNPQPMLYNLEKDPGEKKPARNREMLRKLRGMAVLFQEEMAANARPAGTIPQDTTKARTKISPSTLGKVQSHLALTYAKYGKRTLQLDLYRPQRNGRLPAIVCIHGGGWAKGNRASHGNLAIALAARGFVTATISYRLSGEAPFPAAIHDCKAAVRWLRSNADKYGLDPERIGAIGLSAGGHLTALLATSAGVKELEGNGGHSKYTSAIQAAVPMGAQTDLESARVRDISKHEKRGVIWRQFLGGSQEEKKANYRLASPLHHLDRNDPPMAFITGERDDPSTRASRFRISSNKLGVATRLKVIEDAPHAFLNRQAWFDECVDYAAAFFTVHLKETK
ncbi:MAG: sulfatase-like hydrolase/transferase [Gemmataceae bacterium]